VDFYGCGDTNFCGIMAGQGTSIAGLMLPTRLVTDYTVMAVSTDWHNG